MRLLTIAFLAACLSALITLAAIYVIPWPPIPADNQIDGGLKQAAIWLLIFVSSWVGLMVFSITGLIILRR